MSTRKQGRRENRASNRAKMSLKSCEKKKKNNLENPPSIAYTTYGVITPVERLKERKERKKPNKLLIRDKAHGKKIHQRRREIKQTAEQN